MTSPSSYGPEPAYYLAIDPGETCGWATFKEDGNLAKMGSVLGQESVDGLLSTVKPQLIIIEGYRLFPWKSNAQAFSEFEAVQIIGAVKFYGRIRKIPVHTQPSSILSVGYMWAGVDRAKLKRDTHERDAYVHGVHWLQKNGIRKPQQSRLVGEL